MGGWALHLAVGIYVLMLAVTASHANEVNHCTAAGAKTCSECIQIGTGCAYCPDEIFEYERCDLKENLEARKCSRHMVTIESSSKTLKNATINKSLTYSQVAPQQMSMTLLPGEEREVEMEVFEPAHGPLDLYILMDFSHSMSDDLDKLKSMGNQLAQLVDQISDDYTIGFGKFVDKVTEPQTDMRPAKLKVPWAKADPPFSFRNVITLTKNIDTFKQKLEQECISGNLDAPEGGFDAILQVAVCQEQIGWRDDSTHLLVFSTESAFHYEADGANVLAGILDRNDEQCHLTSDGNYTHDTRQDYPSIPTIVRLLMKHNIIPIFAITNHSYSYYEKLQEYFPIAELGLLQEDSSNILNILKNAFENIRSKISIRAEDRPKAVKVNIHSQSGTFSESGKYKITPGEIGKFTVSLKALTHVGEQHVCKANQADRAGALRVKPTTFSSALRIKTEVLCHTCDCEKTPVKNAALCNGQGDLVCGKCQCSDGWQGPFCNCSEVSTDSDKCIEPGKNESCSGRGDCMCGTCMCYNPFQFEGPFCQFDKSQCQRFSGFLCNDRGSCSMGRCVCTPGWTGDACECFSGKKLCLDSKGGICNGLGECKCGHCECAKSGIPLSPTCEANFQQLLGICEGKRSCVQCQAWNTGERKGRKCNKCPFKIIMVEELEDNNKVIETCSFRDEDDDCTYHYTVNYPLNITDKEHHVLVKKKKDCPPAGFLWLIPLIMFLMLLLGLLLLCCWKYCTCCKACLALLPCCGRGRIVGFTEDHYMLRQSLLTSDHLETPMVRTGPPKSTDIVRWKVMDNVHRGPNHPQNQIKPNPKEIIQYPISLRLNRQYSETLSKESRDTNKLRQEVEDNLNDVFLQIPGAQRVQKSLFRTQRNSGKRKNNTIVDTVLSAPRASYPDIVKLTDKQVQAGNFRDLKVVPGYYTVATDREAAGAVEFQEGVESVDVRVPLFLKDEDDEKKELLVQAIDVPVGLAKIVKDHINITVIKEHARSIFTFLQPSYTYSRQDGVANIPISREIIEDGWTQVTYCTNDLTAKDRKDYISVEGDLSYGPGETEKTVPVKLLELGEGDGMLEDKQVKQFVMDLSNQRQGAKLGRYPRTTVTIADKPGDGKLGFQKNVNKSPTSPGGHLYAPTNIKAVASGPKNIRLNWNPSANASGYKVKYWIYGDPEAKAQVLDVKTPQAELTNLYPYCDYEMRVCGYNALGEGNYSDIIQCQTLEDVPGEPGRLAFNVISPTVTQVSWAEPAETNGVITSYEVIYTPIDENKKPVGLSKKVMIDNPKKRMLLIENLQPSQTYCYKVRARNKVGWGPYRDATINLGSQPTRPMSIPIIPDIPIVDAEAGDEYDSYLMYSNEVLRQRPSVTDMTDGSRWKHVQLVGSDLDLRKVSWKLPADIIPCLLSPATDASDSHAQTLPQDQFGNGKWDQSFLYLGGSGSLSRNVSSSSSTYSHSTPRLGGTNNSSTTMYISGKGGSTTHRYDLRDGGLLKEEVILRKRSENRHYTDSDGTRDSIVMGNLSAGFLDNLGVSSFSQSTTASYSLSSRARTQSEDINDALQNLDGVFQDSRFNPGVPETPSRLVFSALGPTALKVSWQEPHCETDVLGYCILYQLLSGDEVKCIEVNNPAQNSVVVQDLLPNQSYIFKVKAQSREGWGPEREGVITIESAVDPKSPLSPMPGSPFTLSTPSAPGPLIFTALSPDTLQLSWEKPRKPNGDILGYVVTCEQLHGGGDLRSFQVNGNAATSLTVSDLKENMLYKFKVQAQTTQGFGPEREGIITIESQDGGSMSQYNSNSVTKREVFSLPTEREVFSLPTEREVFSLPTEITSHNMFSEPFVSSEGMMMMSGGTITQQMEMVQRGVMSSSTVTKKVERQYY
ncbi:integrin beta-4-like isoform X1 [Carassius auratus]|uniref:Integrin beta n=1 Tax=Carassius auratus TaxID=7957 RepID=A0A6P6N2F7_CARAU|nr:integrin beta-4-like isoform X1 [Carassius auratus]